MSASAAAVVAGDLGLSFSALSGGYGKCVVVRDLTESVAPGEVLGVLGRNGVGKSTLMRLLMGYLPSMAGTISFNGQSLAGWSPHQRSRCGIAYAPQEGVVFDVLSVEENLTLHRPRRSLADHVAVFELFPRLRERLLQQAGTLSGGEKKILSFARTLMRRAPMTLLDEPTEGVQPENVDRMATMLREACRELRSFVLVEQNLEFLMSAADRVLILDHGTAVLSARIDEVNRGTLERHLHV